MTRFFPRIGLIGKQGDLRVGGTVAQLTNCLGIQGLQVVLAAGLGQVAGVNHPEYPVGELGGVCDLVVVIGGDGTFLHAARAVAPFGIPLVGINLGRLGFLADISPERMCDCLSQILNGHFEAEQRSLLMVRHRENPPVTALNDVVIHRWQSARMIEFEIAIDGTFVNAQRADGLIVSTPTGSTAYAMAGGGPLLHPSLDAILLVSICPHTFSNRPLVVPGRSQLQVRLMGQADNPVLVTFDGQINQPLPPGDSLLISQSPHPVRLLHPLGHNHFELLRAKMGWSGHPALLPSQQPSQIC